MCNEIIKKDLLDANSSITNVKLSYGEDFLINLDMFYKAQKILLVNDVYYHYFNNNSSTTHTKSSKQVLKNITDLLYVFRVKETYIQKYKTKKMLYKDIENAMLNTICQLSMNLLQCKDVCKKDLIDLQEILEEKQFYERIKTLRKKDIKEKNIIKKFIKLNIFNRCVEKNYKYKWIISIYRELRNRKNNMEKM